MTTNGESKIKAKDLTFSDKLDVVIQALAELADQVQELLNQQAETNEKIANLTLDNDGYGVERYDS